MCQEKGLAPPSILRSDVLITDDDVEAKYFVFAWDTFFAEAWPRVRSVCKPKLEACGQRTRGA